MMNNKINIVIPTYNRSQYLSEAITSVLNQSYQNFQILVSDNASTDDTERVVKSFHDDRIIYIKHKTNMGMQRNWEFALKYPQDGLVALLEDDNLWLPNHLAEAIDALNSYSSNKPQIYASAVISFGKNSSNIHKLWWTNDTIFWKPTEKDFTYLFKGTPFAASSLIIEREAINKMNFELGSNFWCMDYLWWSQLIFEYGLLFNTSITAKYRWHLSNVSHNFKNPKGAAQYRFVIRYIAETALRKNYIKQNFHNQLNELDSHTLSNVIVSLSSLDTNIFLRKSIKSFYEKNKNIFKKDSSSGHIKLANKIGSWYLIYADILDRIRGKWWPPKIR